MANAVGQRGNIASAVRYWNCGKGAWLTLNQRVKGSNPLRRIVSKEMARNYDSNGESAESGLDTKLDKKPPGSLWRHPKTGRWYWRIIATKVPPEFRRKGKYAQISLVPRGRKKGTRSKILAEACRRELWKRWRSQAPTDTPHRDMDYWLDQFHDWNLQDAKERQARYNRWIVSEFVSHQAVSQPWAILPEHVQHYLTYIRSEREVSTRTIQAHRNTLHKFCRYLIHVRHVLDANPVDQNPVKTPDKRPPRFLTDQQARSFLKHARKHAAGWLYDAVRVALYGGPRLSSLRVIRWQHVSKTALTVPLPKTGNYCIVPLDSRAVGSELAKALSGMKRGPDKDLIFPDHDPRWWGQQLADLTEDLPVFGELEGTRAGNQWHLLRATWAVNCARRGATLWQLMAWGGWKVPQTAMRYVNIAHAAGLIQPK